MASRNSNKKNPGLQNLKIKFHLNLELHSENTAET